MARSKSPLVLLVAIALITMQWISIRLHNPADTRPVYQHTAQQMVDLSTPICRAMLPGDNDLYVSVEARNTVHGPRIETYWEVTYADGAGNPLLHVIRDDETGAVRRISNVHFPYDAALSAKAPPLTAASAVACARSWMRTLGFRAAWQTDGKPQRDRWCWHVCLFTADRQASMNIDVKHGYLILVDVTSGKAKTM